MQYRLRTLLIVLAILPPILAPLGVWVWHSIQQASQQSAEPGSGYLGAVLDEFGSGGSGGVTVVSVRIGAPAAAGGLMNEDLITAINGQPCRTLSDVDAALAAAAAGDRLAITVTRGGTSKTISVTLGARPESVQPAD